MVCQRLLPSLSGANLFATDRHVALQMERAQSTALPCSAPVVSCQPSSVPTRTGLLHLLRMCAHPVTPFLLLHFTCFRLQYVWLKMHRVDICVLALQTARGQ